MMQRQNTSRSSSGKGSGVSVNNLEAQNAVNGEEMELTIDFDNVNDILDFSIPPFCETTETKQRPKLHKRITAKDPVKLLELKPIIDNFVNDEGQGSECHKGDHKTEANKRRFQCMFCRSKFIRSTHLHRHLRIHTGAKPYVCPICRRRFARSDYKSAHVLCHRKDKVHHCAVCGKTYHDLTRFSDHCRSHDDNEYIRIAMKESEGSFVHYIQVVEDPILASTFKEETELKSCITIEKVDNSTTVERIACVENPIYLS